MTINKSDSKQAIEERQDLQYDATRKQKSSEKTARIPVSYTHLTLPTTSRV